LQNRIFAHRGLWRTSGFQKNSREAIRAAFDLGFGIEVDIRDHAGGLLISHDPVIAVEGQLSFDEFLKIAGQHPLSELALNVKSDGLSPLLKNRSVSNNHFYFDMSTPESVQYSRLGLSVASRFSELETVTDVIPQILWVDSFFSDIGELELIALRERFQSAKRVVFVSPELHGRDTREDFWRYFAKDFVEYSNLGICTDYPEEFLELCEGVRGD